MTACNKTASDGEIHRQIIGTWTTDGGSHVLTLAADGSFDEKWASKTKELGFQGTWRVTDGLLVSTVTNRSSVGFTNVAPVGSVVRSHIVSFNATHLTLAFENQTNQWERKQ